MQPALAATASSDVSIEALTGDIGVGAWAVCGTGELKVAPTGEVDAALTVHTNAAVHPSDASRIALRPKFRRVVMYPITGFDPCDPCVPWLACSVHSAARTGDERSGKQRREPCVRRRPSAPARGQASGCRQ